MRSFCISTPLPSLICRSRKESLPDLTNMPSLLLPSLFFRYAMSSILRLSTNPKPHSDNNLPYPLHQQTLVDPQATPHCPYLFSIPYSFSPYTLLSPIPALTFTIGTAPHPLLCFCVTLSDAHCRCLRCFHYTINQARQNADIELSPTKLYPKHI